MYFWGFTESQKEGKGLLWAEAFTYFVSLSLDYNPMRQL